MGQPAEHHGIVDVDGLVGGRGLLDQGGGAGAGFSRKGLEIAVLEGDAGG
jgi:hypothetical protein